jgi:hypothetical protein
MLASHEPQVRDLLDAFRSEQTAAAREMDLPVRGLSAELAVL